MSSSHTQMTRVYFIRTLCTNKKIGQHTNKIQMFFLEKKKRIAKNCRVEKVLLKIKLFTFWLKKQNKPTFKRIMRKICDSRMNSNNGPRNETNASCTIVMMYIACRFVLNYLLV